MRLGNIKKPDVWGLLGMSISLEDVLVRRRDRLGHLLFSTTRRWPESSRAAWHHSRPERRLTTGLPPPARLQLASKRLKQRDSGSIQLLLNGQAFRWRFRHDHLRPGLDQRLQLSQTPHD
jgi:hypothetical protein